ncbi:hypothetical protein LIER_16973 [Lithospermum erythrorhizon]|uniref:Reverse transcriptase domain-containing protein n=1 Tax=Lithospermum erythrorhizon TaxID=34254 RepID=A0AAV3Q8L9_LITER
MYRRKGQANVIRKCRNQYLYHLPGLDSRTPVRIEELQESIDVIKQGCIDESGKQEMIRLSLKVDGLRLAEETYWHQRAGAQWMVRGGGGRDQNTSFFHWVASHRHRSNRISGLKDENGSVIEFIGGVPRRVSNDMCEFLTQAYTVQEIKKAVFDMPPTKAPGPDGMPALVYQKYWDVVREDVSAMVLEMLNPEVVFRKFGFTHVSLIPKVQSPETITQYRPISLRNMASKIISKCIANRLKVVLPMVISTSQSSFLADRLITDNVLLAYETHHALKKKKDGRTGGGVSLKLDMHKVYDRVEWGFLEAIMVKLGLSDQVVRLIMDLITWVTYTLIVNGLISLINGAIATERIRGVQVGRQGPMVSNLLDHLLFADDSLLFGQATMEECMVVKGLLKQYEEASGQCVNFDKSALFFSPNVAADLRVQLCQVLGVPEVEGHQKYLGLPSMIGRNTAEIFYSVKERVRNRIEGWSSKTLPKAGKEVLVKAVL